MTVLTGGGIIAGTLAAQGVDRVFGLPDGTYLSLMAALKSHHVVLITPRHESTAAHMAGAYSRLTGKLGICIASNGPGVANMLPGVAAETAEGNRVILLTTSRRFSITYPDRGGTFQCFDQAAVVKPMAKWSAVASSFERVGELLSRALRESYIGRPGVVHLDVPEDVMKEKGPVRGAWPPVRYVPRPIRPAADLVDRAADMLVEAHLPMIHAGGGVIHAGAGGELATVSEILHAPILTSWSGRGAVPETSELVWPMVFVKSCSAVRNAADTVLCVGSRLGETDFWAKPPYWRPAGEQEMIRVDIDERALDLNRSAALPVLADAKVFFGELAEALSVRKDRIDVETRRKAVEPLKRERNRERARTDAGLADESIPMLTAHVPAACMDVFDEDAVAVFDGGNTAVWGQFYHTVRSSNTQLTSPHFGHLGAGVGQALGAAVARPGKQVYCIAGDGAFGFHLQEIETAVRHRLPVVFLVICDRQWGMIKMSQQISLKPVKTVVRRSLSPEETIATELQEIRYDKLAESMGARGERVADPKELRAVLRRCIDSAECSVVHVDVDPTKHLWAPGLRDFKKMKEEPRGG